MTPSPKRKTGGLGMNDSKTLANKRQKTGVLGMNDLNKDTKKAGANGRTGSRRLQDLAMNELSENDGLMDDLTRDNTIGVSSGLMYELTRGNTLGVSSDVSEDEEVDRQGSDESEDGNGSEAEEGSSEGEDSNATSSVPEEEVEAAVKDDLRLGANRETTLTELDQFLHRVEADNQHMAKMTDEELNPFVAQNEDGGFYDLVDVANDEKVPESELVESASFEEIKPGVWYDATTKQAYRSTNLIDPETGKLRKTVRRHKKGPPDGLAFKVSKISASELKRLEAKTEEDESKDQA